MKILYPGFFQESKLINSLKPEYKTECQQIRANWHKTARKDRSSFSRHLSLKKPALYISLLKSVF
jgi:hypothetical protein